MTTTREAELASAAATAYAIVRGEPVDPAALPRAMRTLLAEMERQRDVHRKAEVVLRHIDEQQGGNPNLSPRTWWALGDLRRLVRGV